MESVENTLLLLNDYLRSSLRVLKGHLSHELKAALHDNSRLPDKKTARLAADAVDLLNETALLLEPGPLVLADHFLGKHWRSAQD